MTTVDIMIVGSQKSGTSSLLAYLGDHPGIVPQQRREMTWFTDPDIAARPFPGAFYFGAHSPDGRRRLGKLSGLMYDGDGLARLVEHSPEVTAVAILREPVARAYAAFWFARRRGREPRPSFEDALGSARPRIDTSDDWHPSGSPYLDWSCYAPYVERLQQALGRDSVHVIVLEELTQDPHQTLRPLADHLALDPAALGPVVPWENSGGVARSAALARARRRGGRMAAAKRLLTPAAREALRRHYRRLNETELSLPPIDPSTESRLRAVFERPNRRLEELIGRPVEVWGPSGPAPASGGVVLP